MSKVTTWKKEDATAVMETKTQPICFGTIAPENDRMVRPKEAVIITGRSLASQYRDKKAGKWPQMFRLGDNSVANKLSDLLALNASRAIVTANNTKVVAVPNEGKRRGRKPKNCRGEK